MAGDILKRILISIMVAVGLSTTVFADFYVIPVNKKIQNVVTVAKSGGKFTDVKAALDSITDASADNPYLVYIGPGVYTVTQTIPLKAHVTVSGSGQSATILRGAISTTVYNGTSAIISGENNAPLTGLSLENIGGNSYSIGIYNQSVSPTITDVTISATGAINNFGIYNATSDPTISNVTVKGFGGSTSCGIYDAMSNPTMNNVTAIGSGSGENYGVRNASSNPTMINVTATGLGGSSNYGLYNLGASPKIYRSTFTGTTDDIFNNSSTPKCYYVLGIVSSTYSMLNSGCE